jgi:hypothetical protein
MRAVHGERAVRMRNGETERCSGNAGLFGYVTERGATRDGIEVLDIRSLRIAHSVS